MRRAFGVIAAPLLFAIACLGGGGPGLRDKEDSSAPPTDLDGLDGAKKFDVDLGDPFAILGLVPSHGPFTGGTRTLVSGKGFPSKLRVWIGNTEIDPSAVLASDPTRAAVTTPPGTPGPVEVRVRDDKTAKERVLPAGFTYDAIVVQPDTGATGGNTRVSVQGSGTNWISGTTVDFGGKPCTNAVVIDQTHIECVTPAHGGPGAVDVTVTTPDTKFVQARDAFVYGDSPDGYRGGLSGGVLSGTIEVIALDNWTGMPIPGATVILGSTIGQSIVKQANSQGIVSVTDPSLKGKVTVTIAEKCHQPYTFVEVPVERVTAYLDPIFDLSCAQGDPPSVSGKGKDVGLVSGELVFGNTGEVQVRDFVGVPKPVRPSERRAAYVFVASSSLDRVFQLPSANSATTPVSPGKIGFAYSTTWYPGNLTLYAVAGIEDAHDDAGPTTFVPYVMGVVRGVPVMPKTETAGVDIPMNLYLSHELTLAPQPPPMTGRGPDRVLGKVALTVGPSLYAFLPQGAQAAFLPNPGNLYFTGVPAMIGDLVGESYVVGATAMSGAEGKPPISAVQKVKTNDANVPITIGGFLPVPVLGAPGAGPWGGAHVQESAQGTWDLMLTSVRSGGGLVTWSIVSPKGTTDFDVPDLAQAGPKLGLVKGPITTSVYTARVDNFAYSKLRYGQLYSSAWSAFAYDVASGIY